MNPRLLLNGTFALGIAIGVHVGSSAKTPSIVGHALDSAGYPIPGVAITAMPEAGGIVKRAMTAADGAYQFESLPEGTYRLDFDILGFDLTRRNHVQVRLDAATYVDATLSVSSVCECVQVIDSDLRERAGQVVDEFGRPVAHARLEISSQTRREVSYADNEGRFRVRLPVAESWTLTASYGDLGAVKQQVTWAADVPIAFRLPHIDTTSIPDMERFNRGCRCPGDLFTHAGR